MSIQTMLPINRLQTICLDTAEACKRTGSKVVVTGQSPTQMTFSVQTSIMKANRLSFAVNILDRGEARGMSSEIETYLVSQPKVMLIPISPKIMEGFPLYKMFMEQAVTAVRKADPSAEATVRDR